MFHAGGIDTQGIARVSGPGCFHLFCGSECPGRVASGLKSEFPAFEMAGSTPMNKRMSILLHAKASHISVSTAEGVYACKLLHLDPSYAPCVQVYAGKLRALGYATRFAI